MHTPTYSFSHPFRSRPRGTLSALISGGALVAVAALGLARCDGSDDPNKQDMAAAPDLSMTAGDLAMPPVEDMKPTGDLKPGPEDMRVPGDSAPPAPMLTGLPTCTETGITADKLWPLVMNKCVSRCHDGGAGGLTIKDAATLKSSLVGVVARGTTVVPRVQAGNLHQSYLIYKLMDQQATVMGMGGVMPRSGKLPDAELCQFIVWVKEGAK